jgi:LAO/AO transport system kinase
MAGRPATEVGLDDLIERVGEGQPRAVGRAITLCENDRERRRELIGRLFPSTGKAELVGVTGPPGAGKSTLVDRLAQHYRKAGERVGILAVDPTSPFTGGAILGDRIRMQSHYLDRGVFIRSMATRGAMGGLARATLDAVDVLDAAGFERILVETVGAGQDEVDVVRGVDTVLVVTPPGLGDDIQAIKAGIMEIADVFVINKADREGADRTARDLKLVLGLAEGPGAGEGEAWRPPILKTVASQGAGIVEVAEAVAAHKSWLESSGELRRRRGASLRLRVENLLKERVLERADQILGLEQEVARALDHRVDPYRVADRLFAGVVESEGGPA